MADQIISDIILREGGYTNSPHDPGGATKYGITRVTLSKWRGRECTVQDVIDLTVGEATDIYEAFYVMQPGFDKISDQSVRAQVVDFGVNSGPATVAKTVQRILGLTTDGAFGPKTTAAVNASDPRELGNKLAVERTLFLADLVQRNPSQLTFLKGWVKRSLSFVR